MEDKLLIGIITKPQGIKGEVKVKVIADGIVAVKSVTQVFIDGVAYKILGMRSSGEDLFLSLKGVADRNVAETLRDKELYALREEISKEEDAFFIVDVLGCKVVTDDDRELGEVIDIVTGRTDIYYVKGENKVAVFPLVKKLQPVFDIPNKVITLNGEKLDEVLFYED